MESVDRVEVAVRSLRALVGAGLVGLLGFGLASADPCLALGDGSQLIWSDEFSGPTLDLESWTAEVMPDPHNQELQYYTHRIDSEPGSNAWIEDGVLVIEARQERFEHRDYTSARLITKGKRQFLYGRFEARMRLPNGVGAWPAFWLLGSNIDEVGWPACGEIDVVEGKGRLPTWVSGALHRGRDLQSHEVSAAEFELEVGDFHHEWHRFAVDWEPERIRWFVDDRLFHVVERPSAGTVAWPFDQESGFFILFNLALGGWFDEPHLPPPAMEPQRLYVDYVRVYEGAAENRETTEP